MSRMAAATSASVVIDCPVDRRSPHAGVHCQTSTPVNTSGADIGRSSFIFQNSAKVQDDYTFKAPIGAGAFGTVSCMIHKRTQIQRAVKQIPKKATKSTEFERELRALISLDHPHIVKMLEYFEDKDNFYVVMELCRGRDLFDYILELEGKGPAEVEQCAGILIRQCAKAVCCCHAKGFIHRDLKPENFIVTDALTVKLIDFGMATFVQRPFLSPVGTTGYMAPEMLVRPSYDKSVDIWSLGVIFYTILTQEPMLTRKEEKKLMKDEFYIKKLLKNETKLQKYSAECLDLLERMLEWYPDKRITDTEVLSHPFIRHCLKQQWTQRTPTKFDSELPAKMDRYNKSSLLRKAGLRCLVHLAAVSALPDDVTEQLQRARLQYRKFDRNGAGQVTEQELVSILNKKGVPVPDDFSDICRRCRGSQEALDYNVVVACLLIDVGWPDTLLREVFHILDRKRRGVIQVKDLLELAHADESSNSAAIIKEVDPENTGCITYKRFLEIMEVDIAE